MISIPVYNEQGQQVGSESLDETALGGEVNVALLKQAVVMYHANRRQGTVRTKSRGDVEGSSRKIYRQKGTGRARRGNIRTPIMKGGGHTFAKRPRDFRQAMPVRQRRLARDNAVLSKAKDQNALIIDGLRYDAPKTARFAKMLQALGADAGCVLATAGIDRTLWKSGRNIPKTRVIDVAELNAFDVLMRRKLVFTRDAFERYREMVAARSA